MLKINIYGDLCPTKSNIDLFRSGDYRKIFGNICDRNRDGDFNIVNLECALGEQTGTVDKSGPSMIAPVECISTIAAAGFNVISVANNHSLDNGIASFEETLGALTDAGLLYVGANLCGSTKEYIIIGEDAERTAILSVGDHEFNTDAYGYGVNVFSHRTYQQISKLKQQVPHLVVIYHSGYENAVYPSPALMERCREMVDCGASAVLCQHSHCIGAYEEYHGSLIVYGQGNFLFDLTDRESWHRGMLVSLTVSGDEIRYCFEPLSVFQGCVTELSTDEKEKLINQWNTCAQKIQDPDFVRRKWEEFLRSEAWKYNAMFRGGSKLHYVMYKMASMLMPGLWLSKKQMAAYLLFMRSDTHREALSDLLQMERRKNK